MCPAFCAGARAVGRDGGGDGGSLRARHVGQMGHGRLSRRLQHPTPGLGAVRAP